MITVRVVPRCAEDLKNSPLQSIKFTKNNFVAGAAKERQIGFRRQELVYARVPDSCRRTFSLKPTRQEYPKWPQHRFWMGVAHKQKMSGLGHSQPCRAGNRFGHVRHAPIATEFRVAAKFRNVPKRAVLAWAAPLEVEQLCLGRRIKLLW